MELTRVVSDLTESELGMLAVIQGWNKEERTGKDATRAEAIRIAVKSEAARIQRRAKR